MSRKATYKGQAETSALGSDEQAREAVRVSNEESLEANQGPTDEKAAEAVRGSNDEQYDAEHEEQKES